MIEKRRFGRTGHLSAVTIFGAAALKNVSQAEADRTLELLLERGVNHIDTAARYGDAELRIGPWMREHRQDFFLATKTAERTLAGARDGIRRSLDRLRVDSVDLLQLHSLAHPGDWETAMGVGGALEAVIEARELGLTRFIGGDRARVDDRLDAPQEPRTLRLRLGAPALELRHARERSLPRGVRGGVRALRGT